MTIPTAKEAQEQARARAVDKQEQLCELSRAIAVLASASVSITCMKFSLHWPICHYCYPSNKC